MKSKLKFSKYNRIYRKFRNFRAGLSIRKFLAKILVFIKMTIFDQVQLDPFRDPDFLSEFGDQFYEFLIENWTKIEPERKSRNKTEIFGPKNRLCMIIWLHLVRLAMFQIQFYFKNPIFDQKLKLGNFCFSNILLFFS